jgi:hypothetical protein
MWYLYVSVLTFNTVAILTKKKNLLCLYLLGAILSRIYRQMDRQMELIWIL